MTKKMKSELRWERHGYSSERLGKNCSQRAQQLPPPMYGWQVGAEGRSMSTASPSESREPGAPLKKHLRCHECWLNLNLVSMIINFKKLKTPKSCHLEMLIKNAFSSSELQ